MSDSPEQPWSINPNAPQIPSPLYLAEKAIFAGFFVGATCYGIVVILFFQCIGVLLSHANPIKGGMKWALVAHTVAMFSFLTIPLAIHLNDSSICYTDDREFPGDGEYPPGPIGCDYLLNTKATSPVFYVMFPLNQWLADGLLLHRCYVIYSLNRWVIAFPCLIYLASSALGVAYIYQQSTRWLISTNLGTPYFSISLSLSVLLTLMIVIRLIMHRGDFRRAIGASDKSSGLYTAVVAMLIESYALYAISFLLYIVTWAVNSRFLFVFSQLLGQIQVIAPYLIILRVAKRRALKSDSIPRIDESLHFRSQGTTDDSRTLPDEDSKDSVEVNGDPPGELSARAEDAIEEVPL